MSELRHSTTRVIDTAHDQHWATSFSRRLLVIDLLAISIITIGTQVYWLGIDPVPIVGGFHIGPFSLTHTVLSAAIIIGWMLTLSLYNTRSPRVIGYGSAEYRGIADSAFRLFGVLAIVSYLGQFDWSRGFLLLSFPLGVIGLMLGRWLARRWLWAERSSGRYISRVLLVGDSKAALRIERELARQRGTGLQIVALCLTDLTGELTVENRTIPILGAPAEVVELMARNVADTVIIANDSGLGAETIRELSWNLEAGRQHLIMAPSLTDVGGPRIHTRPVAGLPLLHVETPRLNGRQTVSKRAFDLVGSSLLILLFLPLFLLLGVLVGATSRGPVFYRQERVGMGGKTFNMIKFRSMVDGAHGQLMDLLSEQGGNESPLFKLDDDPRITPIGRTLRKYSLDELPQLFNVFMGTMSLVGPRPSLLAEVAMYDERAHRRFSLKPGMSGLWQVSGRSSLDWEDAIRLDLFYVENWSLTGDIAILFKTFKAVVAPGETVR